VQLERLPTRRVSAIATAQLRRDQLELVRI